MSDNPFKAVLAQAQQIAEEKERRRQVLADERLSRLIEDSAFYDRVNSRWSERTDMIDIQKLRAHLMAYGVHKFATEHDINYASLRGYFERTPDKISCRNARIFLMQFGKKILKSEVKV